MSFTKTCVANLKQMDSAKEQYAMDHHLREGVQIPTGALWADGGYIVSEPFCPKGGAYTLGRVGELPTCDFDADHSIKPSDPKSDLYNSAHCKDCGRNLQALYNAKKTYALKYHLGYGAKLPAGHLWVKGGLLKKKPVCLHGGHYNLGDIGDLPACSLNDGPRCQMK